MYPQVRTGALAAFGVPDGRAGTAREGRPSLRLPWQLVFHVVTYGLLLGVMHVEASSLVSYAYARSAPYLAGVAVAAAVFWACFVRPSTGAAIWPKIQGVVFPLTAASFMLLPLLDMSVSFVPLALVSCANAFYLLMLALGVRYVVRVARVDAPLVASAAVVVFAIAFLAGVLLCRGGHTGLYPDVVPLPQTAFVAFALLVAATLWVGNDRQAQRLWGCCAEERSYLERMTDLRARCDAFARAYRLTPKQREIAQMLVEGMRPAQIAEAQVVSVSTVRTHIRNIYALADVHSHAELAAAIEAMDPDA